MKELDKQAITEVITILNHSEKRITDKIPNKFLQFLNNNSDKDYKVNIDFSNQHWDDTIKPDAKAILALIYRDYIVSEEERKKLLLQEQQELKRKEQEIREKYNPDNIFKKETKPIKNTNDNSINNTQLVVIKEETWFKKLWNKIISLFGKKK